MMSICDEIQLAVDRSREDPSIRCAGLVLDRDGLITSRKVYRSDGISDGRVGIEVVDDLILDNEISVYEYESESKLNLGLAEKINFHFNSSLKSVCIVEKMSRIMEFVDVDRLSDWVRRLRSFGDVRCLSWGLERSDRIDKVSFYCFPVETRGSCLVRASMRNDVAQKCLRCVGCRVPRFTATRGCDVRIFSYSFMRDGCQVKKMYSAYDRNVAIECCGNSVIGVFDDACNRSGATPILMSFCVDALPSAATMYFRASNKM